MINRNFVLGGLGFLVFLAAQTAEARPPIIDSEGPAVTASVSATYYSNVANSSPAIAALRGLKRGDEVYDPSINLNYSKPMGGITFFAAGQAGYDIHQENSILDRERIDLQAGADAQIDVCQATVVGSWARHQSDLVDLNVNTTKNTQQLLSAEADATCNQSGQIVPSLSVSQSWSTNSAAEYVSQDYHSLGVNGSAAYKYDSLTTVSLIGGYTQTSYPHRIFGVGSTPESDGYSLYTGGVHIDRAIGSTIQLGVTVSQSSLNTDNSIGKGFSGISYDANVGYNPTPRLSFDVEASRQTSPSTYLNAAYSVNERYSGTIGYRISSRLRASLGAFQTHSNFQGAALVPGTDITVQTYRSFYGSLAYSLSPTFSVSLNAGQDQRNANVVGYSYSGGHVGLAVTKAF
jgi:hypothetical protein